ncbi:MAG TPA: DNA translocase FtsK [Gemmatimonadaceae bacterium]|nr:DNA translocase FtsK [Gemmatimonadaceae bacterium]
MGRDHLRRELAGVALALLAVFLLLAIALERAPLADAACVESTGPFGPIGSCLRHAAVSVLGVPAAVLLALALGVIAAGLLGRDLPGNERRWGAFVGGMVVLLPILLATLLGSGTGDHWATGMLGGGVYRGLHAAVGTAGAWIVMLAAFSALTILTLAWNPVRLVLGPHPTGGRELGMEMAEAPGELPARRRRSAAVPQPEDLEPEPDELPAIDPAALLDAGMPDEQAELPLGVGKRDRRRREEAGARRDERIAAELEAHDGAGDGEWEKPPVELLTLPPPQNAELHDRELDAMGEKLKAALATFKVDAEIVGRTTGPVVTQFEVEPAPGVKVRQIANLSNDLALAMRAQSIRIVAPIPGRGAVGVEVPNPTAEIVPFRALLESREYQHARAALPIALGKDLEGKPVIADLAKMPHLLIAGATGSGKSVCVNTIITSLVYRHSPRKLRFLMVDPKMVELSVYNALPHLRHKVITDNRDAAAVLKWAVMEMEERYRVLAANNCRNVQDFNRRLTSGAEMKRPRDDDVAFENEIWEGGELPYIVIVIDELADLMMTVQGEVETPIAMLAQKARAIGIHLILATQRPSVNVITGLIKANFPSRVAFRVASQVDSRTIIDGAGAETLLGNGDMLFIPPARSEPFRLQGAFISSEETETLMRWYQERREARKAAAEARGELVVEEVEDEDILAKVREVEARARADGMAEDEEPGERDRLFREAAEICIQHQGGSTSLLQRRLKIGYGRAARIIDQLHDAGILGPPDGSRPREVLRGVEVLGDL